MTHRLMLTLTFLGLFASNAGCVLNLPTSSIIQPKKPDIAVSSVRLVRSPTAKGMAAYYCPDLVGQAANGAGLGGLGGLGGLAGSLACQVFGAPGDLDFSFDVVLSMKNTGPAPLPVVASLIGFTAYPESEGNQNLGTVCMTFCENPNECSQSADACDASNEPDIRNPQDLVGASAGFLMANLSGERGIEDLRMKTIPANQSMNIVTRLGIEPTQMLGLIRTSGQDITDTLKSGEVPEFNVPYQLDGTVFLTLSGFGRFAADFGPYQDQWDIK